MNWVPHTVDVRNYGNPITALRNKRNQGDVPSELMMSDSANMVSMRVPNFSYTGDLHHLKY
jgi:hypothetical protein